MLVSETGVFHVKRTLPSYCICYQTQISKTYLPRIQPEGPRETVVAIVARWSLLLSRSQPLIDPSNPLVVSRDS